MKSYPPPDDIAIDHKEYDVQMEGCTNWVSQRSKNIVNWYYHPKPHCVCKTATVPIANKNFQFTDQDISIVELEDAYKVLLSKNLVAICNLAD